MKAKLFYSILDNRKVSAFDFGNGHLMLRSKEVVIDSDEAMLEDSDGFRYLRDIEQEVESNLSTKRYKRV